MAPTKGCISVNGVWADFQEWIKADRLPPKPGWIEGSSFVGAPYFGFGAVGPSSQPPAQRVGQEWGLGGFTRLAGSQPGRALTEDYIPLIKYVFGFITPSAPVFRARVAYMVRSACSPIFVHQDDLLAGGRQGAERSFKDFGLKDS